MDGPATAITTAGWTFYIQHPMSRLLLIGLPDYGNSLIKAHRVPVEGKEKALGVEGVLRKFGVILLVLVRIW